MNKPQKTYPVTNRRATNPKSRERDAPAHVAVSGATINRRAADRLRAGHLWVYASDIESLSIPDEAAPPALLPVADSRGLLLGTALYSPASQIALRLISREAIGQQEWLQLLAARLRQAIARRKPMLDAEMMPAVSASARRTTCLELLSTSMPDW